MERANNHFRKKKATSAIRGLKRTELECRVMSRDLGASDQSWQVRGLHAAQEGVRRHGTSHYHTEQGAGREELGSGQVTMQATFRDHP